MHSVVFVLLKTITDFSVSESAQKLSSCVPNKRHLIKDDLCCFGFGLFILDVCQI